jgi:hypothetical protein
MWADPQILQNPTGNNNFRNFLKRFKQTPSLIFRISPGCIIFIQSCLELYKLHNFIDKKFLIYWDMSEEMKHVRLRNLYVGLLSYMYDSN